jgi:hypothetical protein
MSREGLVEHCYLDFQWHHFTESCTVLHNLKWNTNMLQARGAIEQHVELEEEEHEVL